MSKRVRHDVGVTQTLPDALHCPQADCLPPITRGQRRESYKPSTANLKDKYYELFRCQGDKGLERNEGMEEG
jgi:hypothetical protein